jgi:hypothetical protein
MPFGTAASQQQWKEDASAGGDATNDGSDDHQIGFLRTLYNPVLPV